MGEFKKFRSYYAANSMRLNGLPTWYSTYTTTVNIGQGATRVQNFKDLTGVEYGWLCNFNSAKVNHYNIGHYWNGVYSGIPVSDWYMNWGVTQNYQTFSWLYPKATADLLEDYSVEDYEVNAIGDTAFQRLHSAGHNTNRVIYPISVRNNNVDTYVLNDSIIWDETKEYYKFEEGAYVRLLEQPENWTEAYNTYYIFTLAQPITVSCIKFYKMFAVSNRTNMDYTNPIDTDLNATPAFVLYIAYYLDEPITLQPNESFTKVLSFESTVV